MPVPARPRSLDAENHLKGKGQIALSVSGDLVGEIGRAVPIMRGGVRPNSAA